MKNFLCLVLLILFSLSAFGQKPKTISKTTTAVSSSPANEKAEFEKASTLTDAADRISALQKFVKKYPKSINQTRALELIVSARGQIADEKLRLAENAAGVEMFKLAVKEAPMPVSEELFVGVLMQFPTNVFAAGQYAAAIEVAKLIEEKVGGNPKQLLALSAFYLGTENAKEAKRVAERVIENESALTDKPNLPAAYQALGLAERMNFDFQASANAYQKALELDPNSIVSRRSLAEMKRALGKADEAVALYQEILSKDTADASAQTGWILALFDAGKKQEAETELAKAIEANPSNLFLLTGAAYWYAAQGDGAKAVELAQKAVAVEPRYTWAQIALARGFLAQKQPLEAERVLLTVRQYGDFPTLDYELAAARLQAGFYRDAAEILKRRFAVKNDYVKSWMGNRVPLEAKSFLELVAVERQASIFQPLAADNSDNAEKLKTLLELTQRLEAADADETEINALADRFTNGDDNMRLHRQLYVARELLQQKKALPKALELAQGAVGKVDSALDVPAPSAAVLADRIYDERRIALSRGEIVIVPNIERQALSRILRGEIEQITGWALLQQNKSSEAVVRLKRALSILPEKSAWWRSTVWRLGSALEAEGKSAEALDNYIKSYSNDTSDVAKYLVIESLYQKVNGNLDGLEAKIGAKPAMLSEQPSTVVAQATQTPTEQQATSEAKIETNPAASPSPQAEENKAEQTDQVQETVNSNVQQQQQQQPPPVVVVVSENENKAEPVPSPSVEVKAEPVTTENTETEQPKTEQPKNEETKSEKTETETKQAEPSNTPKPLFEPIIITIPPPAAATTTTTTVKSPLEEKQEKKSDESSSKEKTESTTVTVSESSVASGEVRVRKITEDKSDETGEPCAVVVSQDEVSVINGGGSIGVLVGFETTGDYRQIKAISSSPRDIEVVSEPEIGENARRAFFLIKSVSTNKGAFTVVFDAPCGKKEILVKVR